MQLAFIKSKNQIYQTNFYKTKFLKIFIVLIKVK